MPTAPSPALTPGTGSGFAHKVSSTRWTVLRYTNEERFAPCNYLESIRMVTGDEKIQIAAFLPFTCHPAMTVAGVRRAKAAFFPVGERPTRLALQPEAIGAVMEVTKWLEPLM